MWIVIDFSSTWRYPCGRETFPTVDELVELSFPLETKVEREREVILKALLKWRLLRRDRFPRSSHFHYWTNVSKSMDDFNASVWRRSFHVFRMSTNPSKFFPSPPRALGLVHSLQYIFLSRHKVKKLDLFSPDVDASPPKYIHFPALWLLRHRSSTHSDKRFSSH